LEIATVSTARIVVIDDNTADVDVLRLALDEQHAEYELEVLPDGAAALQFVREHRSGVRRPDPCVILLDLHLPKQNGLVVLKAVREMPELNHIKVVVLTGIASEREQEEIRELGAIYEQKPMDLAGCNLLAQKVFAICRDGMSALA
jgi:CheY-like chemotaxis protein